jgi:hypothetical protein
MKLLLRFVIVFGLFLLMPTAAFAETIVIPFDKASIQEGIDVAADGDTILVTASTYVENIDFQGKKLVVTGAEGPAVTFLEPSDPDLPTVSFSAGIPGITEFSGFTVSGGGNAHTVYIDTGSSPVVKNNVFRDNIPAGVYIRSVIACFDSVGAPLITRNVFYGNLGMTCVLMEEGKVVVVNNTFVGNNSAFLCTNSQGIAKNNIVTRSLGIGVDGVFSELDYNDVYDNASDYG